MDCSARRQRGHVNSSPGALGRWLLACCLTVAVGCVGAGDADDAVPRDVADAFEGASGSAASQQPDAVAETAAPAGGDEAATDVEPPEDAVADASLVAAGDAAKEVGADGPPDADVADIAPLDSAADLADVEASDSDAADVDALEPDAIDGVDATPVDAVDSSDVAGDAGAFDLDLPTWPTHVVTTTHPNAACQAAVLLPLPSTADVAPAAAPWFQSRPDLAAVLNDGLKVGASQSSSALAVRTPQGFEVVVSVGVEAPQVRVVHLLADLTPDAAWSGPQIVPKLANCIAQADVDRDGWMDVVCSDRVVCNGPNGLDWFGPGQVLLPTSSTKHATMSITVADILPGGVGDGWPDLLMAEWGGPDRVYQGGKAGFVDITAALGVVSGSIKTYWGFGLFDLDGDGKQEIFQMPDGGAQPFTYHWSGGKLDWFDGAQDPANPVCVPALGLPGPFSFALFAGTPFLSPMGLAVAYDAAGTQLVSLGLAMMPNAWFACAQGACRRVEQALGLPSPDLQACLCGTPPLACPPPGNVLGACSEALNPLGAGGKPRGSNGTTMVGWTTLLRDIDGDGFEDLLELYGDDPGHAMTSSSAAAMFPALFGDQSKRPLQQPTVRRARNDGTYEVLPSAGLDAVGHHTHAVWLHVPKHDLLLLGQRGGPIAVYEVVAKQVAPSFWLRARGAKANLTSGAGGRVRVVWPDGRSQWYALGRFFQPHAFDLPELKLSWRGFDRAVVEVHWQSGSVTQRTVGLAGSVGLPADATEVAAGGSLEIVGP